LPPGWTSRWPVDHLPPGGGAAAAVLDVAGRRIVYSGDTRPCPALAEAARGADLLIHEVGGLDAEPRRSHVPGHSTAGAAGRVAHAAGARVLALTHLPPERTCPVSGLLDEARRAAPDTEVVEARDGLVLTV
jgi:ribonuclease Z